jgi:ribosome-binding factor A
MDSTRQKKISRLLQKELGGIFQRKTNEFGGKMITVTTVRISPDLSIAKIYLSIFPKKKEGDETMSDIKFHTSQIRNELGRIVGKQLRIVPELHFFEDDSLDYIDNIDNLLKN